MVELKHLSFILHIYLFIYNVDCLVNIKKLSILEEALFLGIFLDFSAISRDLRNKDAEEMGNSEDLIFDLVADS